MTKKLKVLFLESQPTLLSDSQVHYLLMQHYEARQVEVHVACNPGTNRATSISLERMAAIPGVRVLPISFGPSLKRQSRTRAAFDLGTALRGFVELTRYVRRNQIDVIHVASRPRDSLYGVVLSKLTGARSVVHLHVMYSDWFGAPIRWALRHCDAILGISEFVTRSALSAGYQPGKTHCVVNGIDVAPWDPSVDGTHVRREFDIAPDAPVLAIVSRLFYWKGHTELLKALALVRAQAPNFRLLIVGEDDLTAHPGGGSYRAELETLAGDLGLSDNVIFTGFRRDIPDILAACDIYAMPSHEEPLGLAFLEAMAMRKPVVALESGGVPEIVEHGKSGLLSAPGDIEGLAANILSLIESPELCQNMGEYGRWSVEEHHNAARMACATERVYRRVIHATTA